MTASALIVGFKELRAHPVEVVCTARSGLSTFEIEGLPGAKAIRAKGRILSAFTAIGLALPAQRIVAKLECAGDVVVGSHCDLAVATALLGELDLVDRETTSEHLFFGQFGNDGQVTRMSGAVLAALFAEERELALVAPAAQMAVLQNVPNLRTIPISSFHELVSYLKTGRHNDTEKHYKVERALPRVNQANSNRFWADIHSLEIEIIANLKQRTER